MECGYERPCIDRGHVLELISVRRSRRFQPPVFIIVPPWLLAAYHLHREK